MHGLAGKLSERATIDQVMFGYILGMRKGVRLGLPGVTEARVRDHVTTRLALQSFAKEFGMDEETFKITVQEVRLSQMVKDFYRDQKTAGTSA